MKSVGIAALAALLGTGAVPAHARSYAGSGTVLSVTAPSPAGKLEPGLQTALSALPASATLPVVIEYRGPGLQSYIQQATAAGILVYRVFGLINGCAARAARQQIQSLSAASYVSQVSLDRPVAAHLDITGTATGAYAVQNAAECEMHADGEGVTVAVIDSGIAPHPGVKDAIVGFIDLVQSRQAPYDDFGHGTHVAGAIAGTGRVSSGRLRGMAPRAQLVGVKVLDQNRAGTTSGVIAGIDWCVTHRDQYDLRVINLSLGHPAAVSYTQDPLCHACEQATQAGLLVVAAAGNRGRSIPGDPRSAITYATIDSPGNDPLVLTVGASNTMGTPGTSDDTVASYSSRGPSAGDHILKPDVVAPGNRIVSLSAPGSTLMATAPANRVDAAGWPTTDPQAPYFTLSGSSMATGVVSGIAALMLQVDPDASPASLKARLMQTADKRLPGDLFSRGAGAVQAVPAVASRAIAAEPTRQS